MVSPTATSWGDGLQRAVALHAGRIRTDVQQVGDGPARASFRDAFEEFADLEEKHDEDSLGELRGRPGQESDAQGAQRGDAHQEVLVHRLAVREGLRRFFQGVPADDEVGDQVEQQVLPDLPLRMSFDEDRGGQQQGRRSDLDDAFPGLVVMMIVCHIRKFMVQRYPPPRATGLQMRPDPDQNPGSIRL